ncbi:hypothetical protein ACFLTR_04420 [Chloroflexota bacterium]
MSRRESRKGAYHYIITQATKLNLDLSRTSDKAAADANYISLDDLVGLKEGLTDPTPQLVVALKNLLKGITSEVEIDEYLVKPFHTKT